MKLKVCGMRDESNILEVASLLPDYMGFIFYEGSKRAVGPEFKLPESIPNGIQKVAVFVDESKTSILKKSQGFDAIQLHGDEDTQLCNDLRQEGFKVIKAFSIDGSFSFESLKRYKKSVDYFLFDSKGPGYGGTGITFDWNLLTSYDQEIPFFISGGISPTNISQISMLKGMNVYAVDINSGVESAPGIKNCDKIREVQHKRNLIEK